MIPCEDEAVLLVDAPDDVVDDVTPSDADVTAAGGVEDAGSLVSMASELLLLPVVSMVTGLLSRSAEASGSALKIDLVSGIDNYQN